MPMINISLNDKNIMSLDDNVLRLLEKSNGFAVYDNNENLVAYLVPKDLYESNQRYMERAHRAIGSMPVCSDDFLGMSACEYCGLYKDDVIYFEYGYDEYDDEYNYCGYTCEKCWNEAWEEGVPTYDELL